MKFRHFMSNPCGYGYCNDWECEKCGHFRPRFFGIPVPRKIGEWLFNLEEYLWFKKYLKENPDDEDRIDF
jgi:hypothetical protein